MRVICLFTFCSILFPIKQKQIIHFLVTCISTAALFDTVCLNYLPIEVNWALAYFKLKKFTDLYRKQCDIRARGESLIVSLSYLILFRIYLAILTRSTFLFSVSWSSRRSSRCLARGSRPGTKFSLRRSLPEPPLRFVSGTNLGASDL